MMSHGPDQPVHLQVSSEELELLRVAVRLLLESEDDPETIEELKLLTARLAQAAQLGQG